MSTPKPSLAERHSDLSQRVILDAAVELLERDSATELSVRAVARQAGISERTVFRYFATRDELLETVAREVAHRLRRPPDPRSVQELLDYPRALYGRFEATATLIEAVLHSELYHRIRKTDAGHRAASVAALLDSLAAKRPERERRLAAANIHYQITASTWHYYRFNFGLSLEDSVECAQMAIRQALAALGIKVPAV